jgi:hypothetical protein
LDVQTLNRICDIANRSLDLFDKWIERKYPIQKEQDGEVWRKGDPLPEPKTPEEYREFPEGQPGRFQQAIAAARRS